MTTFSVTDRSNFKTCREQWDHVSLSRQGLEYPMPNKALLLGTLIHYTFADWLKCPNILDPMWVHPRDRFLAHFAAAEVDIYRRYGQRYNAVMDFEEFEDSYGRPVRDLGAAMIQNYFDDHQDTNQGIGLLDGMRVLAVEQTATLPVPKTEHWTPEGGALHCLEGTFDALIADANGRIFIVDHKTYERKPSQTDLLLNDQFLAYSWMAQQLNLGEVAGVIYNGLWKREAPPKGRTREDLYFKTFIPHSGQELAEFGQRLAIELNEMGNSPVIYLNRNWYSCPFCPIQDLCLAKTRGEDYSSELEELVPRQKSPAWRAS